MKKFLREIFKCRHRNALLQANEGFCPDCGKYLKKSYYIIRCKNCGIKRQGRKKFDTINTNEKFCTNCGESEFIVEKYNKLNFVDVNYAIEVKEVIENSGPVNDIEIWIDEPETGGNTARNSGGEGGTLPILPGRRLLLSENL